MSFLRLALAVVESAPAELKLAQVALAEESVALRAGAQPAEMAIKLSDDAAAKKQVLPEFTTTGYLPAGDHFPTWPEFVNRFGFNSGRLVQLASLEPRMISLKQAGADSVTFGGSFITSKAKPNDIDGIFDPQGVNLAVLKKIDPPLAMENRDLQESIYRGGVNFDNRFDPLDPDRPKFEQGKEFFSHTRPTSFRSSRGGRRIGIGVEDVGTISFTNETPAKFGNRKNGSIQGVVSR